MKLRIVLGLSLLIATSGPIAMTAAQEQLKKARNGTHFLTPDTMQDRGFSIKCDFTDQTLTRGGMKERTGIVYVRVSFDAEKGPKISEMGSAYLFINDHHRQVSVLIRTYNNPETGNIGRLQFSVHEDLLPITEVILHVDKQGSWYRQAILIDEFYKVHKAGKE